MEKLKKKLITIVEWNKMTKTEEKSWKYQNKAIQNSNL